MSSKKFYNYNKAKRREKYYNQKPIFYTKGIDTNKFFFDYIKESIKKIKKEKQIKKIKILDLGTGTGYVPKILCKTSKAKFNIIGIDNSSEMLEIAKKTFQDCRIKYKLADNYKLPFKDKSFDIVTNKLTTRFSAKEIKRVLKEGGYFIFKEYGQYKGFKEIFNIFKKRYVKSKKAMDYYELFHKYNFQEISLKTFLIKRRYKHDEIEDIFTMANLINNFNEKDIIKIKEKLSKKSIVKITSDPFIIYAKR